MYLVFFYIIYITSEIVRETTLKLTESTTSIQPTSISKQTTIPSTSTGEQTSIPPTSIGEHTTIPSTGTGELNEKERANTFLCNERFTRIEFSMEKLSIRF